MLVKLTPGHQIAQANTNANQIVKGDNPNNIKETQGNVGNHMATNKALSSQNHLQYITLKNIEKHWTSNPSHICIRHF
jgi:hypothetical protein